METLPLESAVRVSSNRQRSRQGDVSLVVKPADHSGELDQKRVSSAPRAKPPRSVASDSALPKRLVELIKVVLNLANMNLQPESVRRHIRAAMAAGASCDEIRTLLNHAAALSMSAYCLASNVLEESRFADPSDVPDELLPTFSTCECGLPAPRRRAPPFLDTPDLEWPDDAVEISKGSPGGESTTGKESALLNLAFGQAYMHVDSAGLRRRIEQALAAKATVEEIAEVFQLCALRSSAAPEIGAAILARIASQGGAS
jgi:alkylhydroperoxidase/carboxymuconolactone decarboxylase family protein YurZ